MVGYISGGAPYGVTWEEYERDIKEKKDDKDNNNKDNFKDFIEDGIPF